MVRGGDYLYGLKAPQDGSGAQLFALDLASGEIRASKELPPGTWTLAYAHLGSDLLPAEGVALALEGCPQSSAALAPVIEVTPPPTATPSP